MGKPAVCRIGIVFPFFPAGDGPHPTPCLPDASVEAVGGGEQHEVVLKLPHDTRAGRNADTAKAAKYLTNLRARSPNFC